MAIADVTALPVHPLWDVVADVVDGIRLLPNLEHPVRTVGIVHRPPDSRGLLRVDVYEAGSA